MKIQSTQNLALDKLKILIFGHPGCLSGDTVIPYKIGIKGDTALQNTKGGTLKNLYDRFNKIPRKGKGNYQRDATKDSVFYVSSMDDTNTIVNNEIKGVVYSGKKECYEVTTDCGLTIKATMDHKFFTGSRYEELRNLCEGDVVFVRGSSGHAKKKTRNRYVEMMVKYHPRGKWKKIFENGKCYNYCRIRRSWAVIEAFKNGLTLEEYRNALNTLTKKEIDKMFFLDGSLQVHHLNEDCRDDRVENLVTMSLKDHSRLHYDKTIGLDKAVSTTIKSIVPKDKQDTYDIQCYSPYNNFVANNFIVHNSGKTTLASTIKERVLVISAESGLLCLAGHNIDVIDITTDDAGNMVPEEKRMIRLGEAYKYLLTEECKKKYDWIFIDSLTELSQNLIKSLYVEYPDKSQTLAMYGENSKRIKSLIKSFRDLPFYNVVFTALPSVEKDENNQRFIGVDMVGKISATVPALFDICLYLAKTEEGRMLITDGSEKLVAKDRSGKLNKQEPADLQIIINKVRGIK